MHRLTLFVFALALFSLIQHSEGFIENERIFPRPQIVQAPEIIQVPQQVLQDHRLSRYMIFDPPPDVPPSQNGLFSIVTMPEQSATTLGTKGYQIMRDLPLEFYANEYSSMSQIRKSIGSESAYVKYNYTGNGIKIAIVDTGVDFSNPDLQGAIARDEHNRPIMLDADGQGLVLTKTTFIANINKFGIIENATKQVIEEKNKSLPSNATSTVYVTKNGVYLSLKKDKGTPVLVYNSFFPTTGPNPVFNATIVDDYKIGKSNRDFIKSASGVYHFGMVYQGAVSGPFASVQVVPVLVVDSKTPGLYDTIIPDMSTSYKDYTRFDLKPGQRPNYDFDFTDEKPIRIGDGNEFLIYDSNKDGLPDYSAGTVGAQVLDIHGVISQKSAVDKILKATNGTLLPGLDPAGNFFGVMSDFVGHGTSSAGTIASSAKNQYDIYNNTKKYTLPGVAQGAKIIPIKALWFGDTLYAWMWAAGFENNNSTWTFTGAPRADIISNSWGVSTFPSLKTVPGIDTMSLVSSVLSTPNSLDPRYPGVTIVSSAGNAGHGYGTMGLPNASPFVITVGAVTNNVNVGYGAFKGQPRFGNTTIHANDVVDFSSRGPSILGDPKPDIMGTGAYGFVPSNVITSKPSTKREPFTMYGGTSMAAPVVAGSAAILMESLKSQNHDYTPFTIKNILMSTATDLANDPFTQGAGIVNPYRAVQLARGDGSVFAVYNNSTYSNLKKILDIPLKGLNATAFGINNLALPEKNQPQTSWFGGRIAPGQKATTSFTVENPTNQTITVRIAPKSLQLILESSLHSKTKLNLTDPVYSKTGTYRPDYIKLAEVKTGDLLSYFDDSTIPNDSSLLVLNLNFAFADFMNKTEKQYASDMKIASLYLYDWNDKNRDQKVSSDELSMVNRAGSWGTGQELRVTDPKSKFKNTPLVGVYAVPTKYSYWLGDTKKNATSMEYTVSASYYKKQDWSDIWLDTGTLRVGPRDTASVTATITVPEGARPGLYQGFLEFKSSNHTANAPVSFAVVTPIQERERTAVIAGSQGDPMYGNGYFKGAFDMVNRYNAGDWRLYYFDVQNPAVNVASIDVSWKDPDTNLSMFVIDPQGRIVQTNAPSGAFGHFLDWPTSDWLGTTVFSEGGGFFPVKNKDATSSVLFVPINQTGTYTLLLHNTLFGGSSKTEPFTVLAKFSSLSADNMPPQIILEIPPYLNRAIPAAKIIDDSPTVVKYYLDDMPLSESVPDGPHRLRVEATDEAGNLSNKIIDFVMDRTAPLIIIQNETRTDGIIEFQVNEENIAVISVTLADGKRLYNTTKVALPDLPGRQKVLVYASDLAGNYASASAFFEIKAESITVPAPSKKAEIDGLPIVMAVGGAITIGAISAAIFAQRARKHNAVSS